MALSGFLPPSTLITESGKQKLSALLSKLKALQAKSFVEGQAKGNERSAFSKKMVASGIEIVEILLSDSKAGSLKSKVDQILKLSDDIDNKNGTYIPEIFNAESREFAGIILETIEKFSYETDLSSAANKLISIADPKKIYTTMKLNLVHKIKMYDVFVANAENVKKMQALAEEILNLLPQQGKPLPSSKDFQDQIKAMLIKLDALPYVRLVNAESFINQENPYLIKSDDIYSAGCRGFLVHNLLATEMEFNQRQKDNKQELVLEAYHHYNALFSPEEIEKRIQSLEALLEVLRAEVNHFMAGDHFKGASKLFKSVDKDKVRAIRPMFLEIQKEFENLRGQNPTSIGIVAFNAFKLTLTAAHANVVICRTKNKSLGQMSKITTEYGLKLFNTSFFETDEKTDNGIKKGLDKYRAAFSIEEADVTHTMSKMSLTKN